MLSKWVRLSHSPCHHMTPSLPAQDQPSYTPSSGSVDSCLVSSHQTIIWAIVLYARDYCKWTFENSASDNEKMMAQMVFWAVYWVLNIQIVISASLGGQSLQGPWDWIESPSLLQNSTVDCSALDSLTSWFSTLTCLNSFGGHSQYNLKQ